MDELFKKTNEFLVEFEKILNKEFEKNEPTTLAAHEAYDYLREWDYLFEELWEKESKYYLFGARHQYQNTRNYELKELNDKGVFFRFCKFKVYEKTYKERLNKFQEIYVDAQEISFLEDELEAYSNPIGSEEPFKYLDLKQKKNLTFTRKRTVDFLVQQAKITGYNIIVSGDESDGALSYEKEKIKNIAHSPLLVSNSTINETKPPIKNQHPSIFEDNAFDIFLKWLEISKDEVDMKKISFIIQKLKSLDKIRNSNFKYITQWLKDNDFIDEKTRQDFIVVGSFDASSKILTKARNNLYDTISTNKENR